MRVKLADYVPGRFILPLGCSTLNIAILLITFAVLASAQVPTGSIAGEARDPSGAALAGAVMNVKSQATGFSRSSVTSERGDFSFPTLPAGDYEVSLEAVGFQRLVRHVLVEAGTTTTADFNPLVGTLTESISVDEAAPQLHYDSHTVGGVVTEAQIEDFPLNGRSFLELAKLEPGVQPPTRASSNRIFVPVLGSPGGTNGRGTRVTVDGGSVMSVGNGGSSLGLSQETVQEFQVSTVNFDLSTGPTFSGSINVVTRSGDNQLHGTAFYYFRDHKLAAYPALNRDTANPDPFFQRRQFGIALGGPIRRDRVFFFGNVERNEQRGVSNTTLAGDFAHLSGITASPLFGDQVSVRVDGLISIRHTAFLRYSHDGNRAFGPVTNQLNAYPSTWVRQLAWADQSLVGLTSVLRPSLINDLRFSYFFISSSQLPPQQSDCPGCLGIGAPTINITQAGLSLGESSTILNLGRRFHFSDSASLQTGPHRLRFGLDWEHNRGGPLSWSNEPVTMTLFSPDQVRQYNALSQTPVTLRIPLPDAFHTLTDVLSLPLQSFTMGIGDPRLPQENGGTVRAWNTARLFLQDTWRLQHRLTLNYGLAWNIDRNQNYDLTKPALLAPILGTDGLGPTRKNWANFSPSLGLAWSPSQNGNTVIRAGAGIFYDFLFQQNLDLERALLGHPGLGRQTIPGSSIMNPLGEIPGVASGLPLQFNRSPTLFTGADLMAILPSVRADQQQKLTYTGDSAVRAIQVTKQATNGLYPTTVPTWSAQHLNLGVQRQIARDFVLTSDFIYRHFIHGGLGASGVDLNHYNSVQGPIIPICSPAQQNDLQAICSTGPINVWQAASRQTYKGLLVRAEKRFSHRYQMLGSYAYSSNTGTAGSGGGAGLNLANWLKNPGPLATDVSQILNLAGMVQLPARLEVGINYSYSSAPPFSATVGSNPNGIDFDGDGTFGDLLPGTTVNSFNRGLGRSDLIRLVDVFNRNYAGTNDPHGRMIPTITLPQSFGFGDNSHSLDLRLTRTFRIREFWNATLIGEVFNLYNNSNLTGYSGDLTSAAFGQPTSRSTQVFGSGGPRAFQLALRISF
jgi:hypothetical protein